MRAKYEYLSNFPKIRSFPMLGFYNYTVILTYLSLCSGVTGIWFCMTGHPVIASICLLFSGLCDAFDGRVARMRKQSTEPEKRFGIQLASLCDLVCFGVLPCFIGYAAGMKSPFYIPVFCLFTLAALIRLAYFNVTEEERQQQTTEKRKNYLGLPVTSSSLIFPAFIMLIFIDKIKECYMQYIYLAVLLITATLFVVKSLKVKKPGLKGILMMVGLGTVIAVVLIVFIIPKLLGIA